MLPAVRFYTYSKRFEEAYTAAMRPLTEELDMTQPAVDILLFLANNPGMDTARDICTYRHLKPAIVSFHVERDDSGLQMPVGADVPGGIHAGIVGQKQENVHGRLGHIQFLRQGAHGRGVGLLKALGIGIKPHGRQHGTASFQIVQF